MNPTLLKPVLLIALVLVVPVLVIAAWGEPFAQQLRRWRQAPLPRGQMAVLVVTILAADVVLPVPSGPLSTLAGSQLGAVWGAIASTLGMTLGAVIAFALARQWGRPLAVRLASDSQLAEAELACQQHGAWALVITRPLPILAEACALLMGGLQMRWRQFLPPVIASNFALGALYSVLGERAAEHGWLPLAVCLAAAAPFAALVWRRRAVRRDEP